MIASKNLLTLTYLLVNVIHLLLSSVSQLFNDLNKEINFFLEQN